STLTSASPGNLFSTQDGSGRYSGLFSQSQSASNQYVPAALDAKVPVYSQYYPATLSGSSQSLSQSSQKWQPSTSRTKVFQPSSTAVLQGFQTSGASQSISQYPSRFVSLSSASADGSSLQLQGTSSQRFSTLTSAASPGQSFSNVYTSSSLSRAGAQLAGSSRDVPMQTGSYSADGSSLQLQGTSSHFKVPLASMPLLLSAASPGQSFSNVYTSSSLSRAGAQLAASHQYVPTLESSSGSSSQPQGTTSQYAPILSLGAKVPVSSQYYPATLSGSSQSLSQSSQKWQPSTSGTKVFQPSSTAVLQGFQTSGSLSSASADGSSLQLQGTSSQYAPAPLDAEVPVYSQAAPSGFSLPTSQPSQWQPSTWSQGFQASGTVASQSSSPSQGSKFPSRFSTLTSAASPDQSFSTQDGSGRYSGLSSQSQSASVQYNPGSPAYVKRGFSLLDSSRQSSPGQSFSNVYTSSSLSRAGAQLAGSSRDVPMQTGSYSADGSSLQLQGTSSQYAPASLVSKVPPYKPAAPSGSLSLSQPSQWQPSTSTWSQGFQASGTVASQSSSPSQGSKFPSRFSTLTSAASPDQSFSTQDGSGRYSGLSSQSQSASVQYNPGSPAYVKRGFSLLDSSRQSTEDGSGRYSGLSSQSQSASIQYNPGSPAYAKRGFSLFDSSRQSTGDQSSSPQFSSGSSSMAALSLPVDSVAQSSSSNSWRTSSLSGVGLRPSMVSKAASGSIRRQMSPGLFGSVQHPTDSTTYGQKPSWRDFSSVKG
ncbi:hypothetical protein PO909_012457, partial [Leuciscus waleckii]